MKENLPLNQGNLSLIKPKGESTLKSGESFLNNIKGNLPLIKENLPLNQGNLRWIKPKGESFFFLEW